MRSPSLPPDVQEQDLGIVFFDLARFARWANGVSDRDTALFLQDFYALAADTLGGAGVRIVKFIGDAGLAVFEPALMADAVEALRAFAGRTCDAAKEVGFDTELVVKVHVGPVIAGTFGPPDLARFDVFGRAVNEAALLPNRGADLVLSRAAREYLPPRGG